MYFFLLAKNDAVMRQLYNTILQYSGPKKTGSGSDDVDWGL